MHDYDLDKATRQIALEKAMTTEGAERYGSQVQGHKDRMAESQTDYGQTIVKKYSHPLSKALEVFRAGSRTGKAGRRHAAGPLLDGADMLTLAYITVRTVADAITGERTLLSVVHTLGQCANDEIRYATLRESNADAYRILASAVQTRGHERKRAFTRIMTDRFVDGERKWTKRERILVGSLLLDKLIETTGLVEVKSFARFSRGRTTTTKFVVPTEEVLEWIDQRKENAALLCPHYLPMIVPPKPWTGLREGGYLTSFVRPLKLVKTRYRGANKDAYDYDNMPLVYQAVNHIQATPWKINGEVLEVMDTLYESGAQWANIPSPDPHFLPPLPTDIDTNEEARKEWRKAAAMAHNERRKSVAKRMTFNRSRTVAHRFLNESEIFFPHQLDFRGRCYAVPSFNPQGADHTRALMHFSKAIPFGLEGYKWFLVQGAGLIGVDKVDFAERCRFVESIEEEILSIAEDPYAYRGWIDGSLGRGKPGCETGLKVDKPWAFLAYCFEYRDMVQHIQDGGALENFPSRISVALDGSCSGIQHYSMILRDKVGGRAVNLLPGDVPEDIYRTVAAKVEARVINDVATSLPLARQWLAFCGGEIGRKIVKRSVMTYPYGSGKYGFKQQLLEDFLRPARNDPDFPFERDGYDAAGYLAGYIDAAIKEVVVAAAQGMEFLRAVAKVTTAHNTPLNWTSPLGFPVYQATRKTERQRVKSFLGGNQVRVDIHEETDELCPHKQKNGVAPNFIHSMDATHLLFTTASAFAEGIRSFTMIHDSFGTHCGNTEQLFHIVRECMADMYETVEPFEDFLEGLKEDASEALREDLKAVEVPPKGELEPRLVEGSLYAFA